MNRLYTHGRRLLLFSLSPLALFLIWEICARLGWLDVRFFPAPSTIVYHLIFVSPEEGILTDIAFSVYRIIIGYVVGCGLGMVLGVGMGLSRVLRMMFYPVIVVTYPIPKIAVLPLIMLIFGIGDLSKIVVVAIGSFFLVLINTLHGVDNLDKIFHDVARVYKVSYRSFIVKIVLPGALPSIFTGLKLAIGYSLVIVVAAEFSGASRGIGYLIWQSWETFSIKSMYAGIFVIGMLGFIFSYTLDVLERRLVPWKDKK
ncbi:MAG: ABC transporter permease [Gammaproteobacteria bacterium]|jgi:NitT/TauT family transport system permease protein